MTANAQSDGPWHPWPGTLVDPEWLEANLSHPDLRVVDIRGEVRTVPTKDGARKAEYLAERDAYDIGHIPGAVFVNWVEDIVDLDDPIPAQLAPPDRFAAFMSGLGVGDDSLVVVYDGPGRAFATRLWWALTYYGHQHVAVLDGGWDKWNAESRPASAEASTYPPNTFTPKPGRLGRKTGQEVLEHVKRSDAVIIDALGRQQYTGEEPRGGVRSGHIPGALNVPYTDLFTSAGTWKSTDELRAAFVGAGLIDGHEVVAYCGGGVAATAVLFALDRIGLQGHNYDGSWNEWGSSTDFPVRQGAEP